MAIKEFLQLMSASGALLTAKSALFGIRVLVLLLVAVYARETVLADASFALSLTEIGRWFADFGTDTWSVRAIAVAGSTHEESRVVAASLLIKFIGSVIVGPAIYVVCVLKLDSTGPTLGAVAATLLVTSQIVGLAISYFQAKAQLRRLRVMLLPCILAAVAPCFILLVTRRALLAFEVMAAGELLIAATLFGRVYWSAAPFDLAGIWRESARMAYRCVPVAALGVVVGLYSRVDTLVLAKYSFGALAAYTVAQRLFQPFQIAASSFGAVIYTQAAKASAQGHAYISVFFRREMPSIIAVSIGMALVLYLLGTELLATVFHRYSVAQGPLTLLCLLLPLLAYNSAVCSVLVGYGRFWTVLWVGAVDLFLTCLAMIYLVPRRQSYGTVESLLFGALFNGTAFSLAIFLSSRSRLRQAV